MDSLKIVFLASHWRLSLIRAFQDAKPGFENSVELICMDSDPLSPSFKEADRSQVLPLFSDPECLQSLVKFCESEKVSALIPLTNKAIEFIAENRKELSAVAQQLCIPEDRAIETCHDKWKLYEFLNEEGVDTPPTYLAEQNVTSFPFPLIAKPRRGEGGKGLFVLDSYYDWDFYTSKCPQHVFQQQIEGKEFSVDCYFDRQGSPRLIVPRERLAVRGGEVMVSRINMDSQIIESVKGLGAKLGLTGPCTIQGIKDEAGKFYFTDVNLRFGSGYVHTLHAGGDVPGMMIREILGQELNSKIPAIKDQSVMTRFTENIFHE